jgi:hypothetical protein
MFPMSPIFGIYFLAIPFALGALIGAGACAIAYRSRRTVGLAIRAAVFGGLTYLGLTLIAGRAEQHSVFENGRRVVARPAGKSLRFRNMIANDLLIVTIICSAAAGLMAGVPMRKKRERIED